MTIQTKWDVDQRLFAMKNNKAITVRITKIEIQVKEGYGRRPPEMRIIYFAKQQFIWFGDSTLEFFEDQLFSTKEDLLKSL